LVKPVNIEEIIEKIFVPEDAESNRQVFREGLTIGRK